MIINIMSKRLKAPDLSWPIEQQFQFLTDQCLPGMLGMKLISLSKEEGVAEIASNEKNIGIHGLMHGGTIFSVGDTVTALMTTLYADENTKNILTVNASIRYLRPVEDETITSVSKVTNREGQKIYFITNFVNAKKKRVAQAKYLYTLV